MLRPLLPRIGNSLRTFRRSAHSVPDFSKFRDGVPGLLSPAGFDMAWTQYQGLMVEKLNNLIVGGEYEFKTPKDIAIKYARDPNSAPVFNYASMAHNNAFFFETLASEPVPMPQALNDELVNSFGSIETLQREFIVTASSMFGPGFVWLMKSKDRKYSLLCTYLAGSPYPGAHYRRQPVDMNTEDPASVSEAIRRTNSWEVANTIGSHGPHSRKKMAPGGIDVNPILCVNTWEHVYLPDYGLGAGGVGGKKAFVESWWHCIDWAKVAEFAEVRHTQKQYAT